MPPQPILNQLDKATARLIDRQLAPGSMVRRFAGVSGSLLVGHPKVGGFGALPWKEHIRARHAKWGVRLIAADDTIPWVFLARIHITPSLSVCPAWRRLGIAMCNSDGNGPLWGPSGLVVPQPLKRMAEALNSMPTWAELHAPIPLGPWCAHAPLWCNPFLHQTFSQALSHELPRAGLESVFGDLAEIPTLRTIQHALSALHAIQQVRSADEYRTTVWPTWFSRNPLLLDRYAAQLRLQQLINAIPGGWRAAAATAAPGALQQLPDPVAVVNDYLLPRIGWFHPSAAGRHTCLLDLTVKCATTLQLQPIATRRAAAHQSYLSLACQNLPAHLQASLPELHQLLSRMWQLPWDNQRKELFWRLCVDGLPTAARMHMFGEPCACGTLAPDRKHHFWDCPVAEAVIVELRSGLSGCVQCEPLRMDHVWLARRPSYSLHPDLWLVICIAALLGMNAGRKRLVALRLAADHLPILPQLMIAKKVAAAMFWDMLADFVYLKLYPVDWLSSVDSQHPFLGVQIQADGTRVLMLRRV